MVGTEFFIILILFVQEFKHYFPVGVTESRRAEGDSGTSLQPQEKVNPLIREIHQGSLSGGKHSPGCPIWVRTAEEENV